MIRVSAEISHPTGVSNLNTVTALTRITAALTRIAAARVSDLNTVTALPVARRAPDTALDTLAPRRRGVWLRVGGEACG